MLLKYKTVYKVIISGKEVGYILNKNEFKKLIEEKIINKNEVNVAYVDISELPEYQLVLTNSHIETNEEEIFNKVNNASIVTYKLYEIAVEGKSAVYVNSIEEAEETVNNIKSQYKAKMENIDISVNEIYTQDINSINETIKLATTVDTAEVELLEIVNSEEKIKSATLDGVYFGVKPVSGTITSRFGANESIRDHTHKGMDIAAPYGTKIVAAADGKVTYSGSMGGYGNLIIITHENGIQTYYGHCSKLIAKVGDEVKAGDEIAKVGSTGFSTGNHLHFEIRKNGSQINPQMYLYK